MGRFDWATEGNFDITDTPDEEFKAKFNTMTSQKKLDILADLDDETATAEEKKKALDFLVRTTKLLIGAGGLLV